MTVEQNLWSLRLPNGDVRSGTIEQLEEAFRAGHIDGNSYVLPPGAREWVKLDSIASRGRPLSVRPAPVAAIGSPNGLGAVQPSAPAPPAASRPPSAPTPASADIWQVRLANGEIRSGTRQQLEEAFLGGHIDGSSPALPAGAREWMRLDNVLRRTDVAAVSASVSPQHEPATPNAQGVSASPPQMAPHPPVQPAQSNDDVCHAKVTRRQLEDAFRAGYLDDGVLVLTFGATEWVRLGSLVDRGPVAPPPPSVTQTGAWPPPAETAPVPAEEASPSTPLSDPVTEVTTEKPLVEPTENDSGVSPNLADDATSPEMPSLT